MKRYWFEFEFDNNEIPYGVKMGCGVTAYNENDAMDLVKTRVFKDKPLPRINKVIEDVDVSTLDHDHVLKNMSAPNIRGIWFPLGYN